jgi:hypothetical protein
MTPSKNVFLAANQHSFPPHFPVELNFANRAALAGSSGYSEPWVYLWSFESRTHSFFEESRLKNVHILSSNTSPPRDHVIYMRHIRKESVGTLGENSWRRLKLRGCEVIGRRLGRPPRRTSLFDRKSPYFDTLFYSIFPWSWISIIRRQRLQGGVDPLLPLYRSYGYFRWGKISACDL